MATKIIWPIDAPEERELIANPDGSQSAEYVDNSDNTKTVVIHSDGSRDQTLIYAGGRGTWKIRYELDAEGVRLQRSELPDGVLWKVLLHPGEITHTISYSNPDGSFSEVTYFARGLEQRVERDSAGQGSTVLTDRDGIQRISTQ